MLKYITFVYFLVNYVHGQAPLVITNQGVVSGLTSEDGSYDMYVGIPYGAIDPSNPFGPSSPHPNFVGTFEAIDDSAICPQQEEFNETITGSLDCLHLSVFVPNTDTTPKAVLCWIYGGRFEFGFYGTYLYGPRFLMRQDIIVVTLNYRTGPFGFMCTNNPRVPGNQGLKDQELALKWVNENIANFGGDPNRITLAGNSAGSMSTDFQILRGHEPRLFHQAIVQSGTTLSPSFDLPDKNAPLTLARHFGVETTVIDTALDFLATLDALDIIDAFLELRLVFRPCIEETFEGVEAFVSHNWVVDDTLSMAKDLNIIIGFNNDEGLGGFLAFNSSLQNVVANTLQGTFDLDHPDFTGVDVATTFLFGDEAFEDNLQIAANLRADTSFVHPAHRSANRYLNNGAKNVFMYMFTHAGERNFVKHRQNITQGGALHADELSYIFDISYMEEPNADDQLVVDRMTAMWANFAKYGDPTPQTSNLLPVKWTPIAHSQYNYIDISTEMSLDNRAFRERMSFLDLFFEKYGHLQRFALQEGQRTLDKWLLDEFMPY